MRKEGKKNKTEGGYGGAASEGLQEEEESSQVELFWYPKLRTPARKAGQGVLLSCTGTVIMSGGGGGMLE